MAVIQCPNCGNRVSTLAKNCPHCGTTLSQPQADPQPNAQPQPQPGGYQQQQQGYQQQQQGYQQTYQQQQQYQQPQQPQQPYQQQQMYLEKPDTYLVFAVLVTICCCMPFGAVAIAKATQVDAFFNMGQYEEAQRASDDAKKWTLIALGVGLTVVILYCAFYFIIGMSALSSLSSLSSF